MTPAEPAATETRRKGSRLLPVLLQIVLSVAVLGCGMVLATYYLKTGPKAKPQKRAPSPPLVEVQELRYGPHRMTVSGMGTVLPAKEIDLLPGVSGEVIGMSDSMVPGGFFLKDDLLVTIDPVDYQLGIRELQSEVAQARSDLELEMGNQRIARKEFELLGQQVTEAEKKLMLRLPQLEMKKAILAAVEARLAQARLDLQRTRITAPFNGVVLSRSINTGTRVSLSTPLARLVGTDEFWLRIAIPTDQLKWIHFPLEGEAGSKVRIFQQQQTGDIPSHTGEVIRLAADIEEQGRMASVYVAIDDPLSLHPENRDKPQLLLDSFVRVTIMGTEMSSVVPIDRDFLREDDKIWLMREDNSLEIRKVEIVARTADRVFVSAGLKEGERLIVSNLPSPVENSPLRLLQQKRDEGRGNQAAYPQQDKGAGVQ